MMGLDRRSFLRRAGAVTAGTVAVGTGVEVITQRLVAASSTAVAGDRRQSARRGYGELKLKAPVNGGESWLGVPPTSSTPC